MWLRECRRESMNSCMQVLNECSNQIQSFSKIPTNNPKSTVRAISRLFNQNLKRDKEKAFKSNLEDLTRRFQKTSQQIKEKEQLFIDLATNRDSNYSQPDNERTAVMIQAQKREQ